MADVSISPSSLLCSLLLLGVAAIGVVAYSLVKSYINNKSNAESLAENVLLKYFCNFATSMVCVYLVRFLIWVAFTLKPPLLQYLGQWYTTAGLLKGHSLATMRYIKKFWPQTFLTLPNTAINIIAVTIGLVAVVVVYFCALGDWYLNFNLVPMKYLGAFHIMKYVHIHMYVLMILMWIGLAADWNKTCNMLKMFFEMVQRSSPNVPTQIQPAEVEDIEMSVISPTEENVSTDPKNEQEDDLLLVSPGIHLLTFVFVASEGVLMTGICLQYADECKAISMGMIIKLINIAMIPVVWIFAKPELRNWSRIYLRQRLGLETNM